MKQSTAMILAVGVCVGLLLVPGNAATFGEQIGVLVANPRPYLIVSAVLFGGAFVWAQLSQRGARRRRR